MVNKDVDALAESEIIHENRELLVLYLPWNWQELVAETGALNGLHTDESAEHLLRVLPLHFGHGHSRHGTAQRARQAELADLSAVERQKKSKDCLQALCGELAAVCRLVILRVNTGPCGFAPPSARCSICSPRFPRCDGSVRRACDKCRRSIRKAAACGRRLRS